MKEKVKVPELRFPGFTDDWEERKLIDLATTYIGLVTTMTENYTNKGTLLIRNSDIKEGRFDLSNPIYLEEQFAEENKTRRMRKGDVVTVHTGDIGTSAMINNELEGAIGFATITTRPTKELDSNFLAWYFNSNYHKKYAKRMSTGDGRSNYNMKDFNKNVIPTPQIDEQQKIGAFFKQLDDTIALHQHKLDLLKEQKKGFLQKMFPKNGAKVPELRFAGFADAWELRKLEEISDKVTEKNKNSEFVETLTNSAEFGIINQRDFFDKNISNEKNLNGYYIVREDDFVYNPRISNYAPVGPIKRNKLGRTGVMSPLYYVFRPHNIDKKFLEYYFDTTVWHKFMKMNGDSGARADRFAIKDSIFKTMPIPYPSIEEQRKIGKFFDNLNDTITLHQRKLDLLKEQKKGFLQKMFV